jgi:uncharacterized membrane protein
MERSLKMANDHHETNIYIDAPLNQYKSIYKDLHEKHATLFIDELILKSKVNIEENQSTVKEIKKHTQKRNDVIKIISKLNTKKILLILLLVVMVFVNVFSGIMMSQNGFDIMYLGIMILAVILFVTFLLIIIKKLNPKIKESSHLKQDLDQKINGLTKTAWVQLSPLNQLFTHRIHTDLFQKTIPFIKLDPMFDSKRLDYLVSAYGLSNAFNKNRSTLFVQSGDIHGNPFYVCKDLVHHIGTKSYSGSITIHWTTTSVVNGKRVTNHHTQVLTATVDKPFPLYTEQAYLVYGNDAAPDLSFSRVDSDAEHLTQKQIDRKVDRDIKKLQKKTEKSIKTGQNYTVMGNSEFEVLFGANNRDNEVQFRMLFTPLAQRQLLELMKEKVIGFGDNFDFVKRKKINMLYPEHLANFKFDIEPQDFKGYDLEAVRKNFIDLNSKYFRHIYFAFAPLLAIPLYQQQKPHEYIYKDLYNSYVSFYEHEHVVNHMNMSEFKHHLSATRNILKTRTEQSKEACDTIKVTAYGYRTEDRIDYITKFGGDGRNHTIPVRWVEYLPVEKETSVEINAIQEEKEASYQDKVRALFEGLKNRNLSNEQIASIGSFIAYTIKK